MYIDVLVDSIVCNEAEIQPNRFVSATGSIGGNYGVTRFGGKQKQIIDVIVLGIAEVEVASGQTIVAGDMVKPDTEGRAVKVGEGESGFVVKNINGNLAEVLIR